MRILVIAYEFPPIIAAQSLRWFYLADGLARLGVEVHVLCPSLPAAADFPVRFHDNVVEHRTWPGPFVGLSQRLAPKSLGDQMASAAAAQTRHPYLLAAYWLARSVLDNLLYPDLRTEWYPFARSKLASLLAQHQYDVVISSYEPGVDILLGLFAKEKRELKWLIDLADPILAPYSPRWRHGIDTWFERRALNQADRVVVTTERVLDLLLQRHHVLDRSKFVSIPQGFCDRQDPPTDTGMRLNKDKLNIVFTGTFYQDFRNPSSFTAALRALRAPDVRLTIAGDNSSFLEMFRDIANVTFAGKIDHFRCLSLQRQADILLNIGNAQGYQIPGKLYEYLGANRPIIHITTGTDDAGAELIRTLGVGTVVENDPQQIQGILQGKIAGWRLGETDQFAPNIAAIGMHSWTRRSQAYFEVLRDLSS